VHCEMRHDDPRRENKTDKAPTATQKKTSTQNKPKKRTATQLLEEKVLQMEERQAARDEAMARQLTQ
jgi:hypothetical protein